MADDGPLRLGLARTGRQRGVVGDRVGRLRGVAGGGVADGVITLLWCHSEQQAPPYPCLSAVRNLDGCVGTSAPSEH